MACNLAQKLIRTHLAEGEMRPGTPIGLRIDQTLTQDATGTLVMLALEALDLDRVRTGLSVQYVDHNLIQADHRNPDDHLFLESACRRFGILYSGPGNGVSHPVHMQRFGRPGQSLLGSDSHSCAAGALGMLAIGAGGLDVAMAMAGEPYRIAMPEVWGIELTGRLPDWVSAKDVILEMLRRHGVDGGTGRIIEYHGPGLDGLSAMDRHVIANMGAELGATTTVFPADDAVRRFLAAEGREAAFDPVAADPDAGYDVTDRIDLSELEPLIARPSSPGNVVPVREVAGAPIYQAYIGSSANPGYRDFAVAAAILKGRQVDPTVSLDVNPTSRRLLVSLAQADHLSTLIRTRPQLTAATQAGIETIYCEFENPATYKDAVDWFRANRVKDSQTIWVAPPRITKPLENYILEQVKRSQADGYLVRNYDHLAYFAGLRCMGDFSLNVANALTADYFLKRCGLERVTASYDLNADQLVDLLRSAPPEWFEITLHQHMPMFHMEHCVFCAFLSDGKDFRDCGRPCESQSVKLRDRVGTEHVLIADAGCRNTVFNGVAQTGAEYAQRLMQAGARCFRLEFLNESPEQVERAIAQYRQLLAGDISGQTLWRSLQVQSKLGVTRGPLDAR
ncbi:hypothetical protein C8255_20190 [filamentous cyanobacterium CCP3]|nr:hypothetical protein C8255_20190 [filamentous cyanobacterium CCP3]